MQERIAKRKCYYDEALDLAGFGLYTCGMLTTCCLLILAMYLDIFGLSVALPVLACDLQLSSGQQALLSAVPLIGVMLSSYAWGLCADTLGRRSTLVAAMTVGAILNVVTSFAPNFESLAVLKFCSAGFTASANAAGFVLVGETTPARHRNRFMFLMASATMLVQLLICLFALPILKMTFRVPIAFLGLEYRPWRLLLLTISLPGVIGVVGLLALNESPKFLMSKGRETDALEILMIMFKTNKGAKKEDYPVSEVLKESSTDADSTDGESFLRRMWNQTAPLFQPPLMANSLKIYFILLCAYMTSTGFTMWVPTVTNAFFDGDDGSGKTFCEVASTATAESNMTTVNCDEAISQSTLLAVMAYSGVSGTLNVLLSFVVGTLGRRNTSLLVFTISAVAGVALLFVRNPLLNVALFYVFLYVALILGNMNSFLVELNPTRLRGMATCLSVVVARGFGFASVQLIAATLANHCQPMLAGYICLVVAGGIVSISLPGEEKKQEDSQQPYRSDQIERQDDVQDDYYKNNYITKL